jgi:DNA-directed RNA polymerase specialized sigma24 family protein
MEVLLKDLGRLPKEEAEKALFARYREDASAFTAIYEWFGPELLVFIKRSLEGSLRSYAEDILHETFLAFHLKRDQLEPNTKLRGLLYRIAERRVNDEVRAATTQKRHPGKSVHPAGEAHLDMRGCDPKAVGYDEADAANDPGKYGSKYGAGGAGIYLVTDPKNRPELRDAKIELDDAMARLPASVSLRQP